MARRRNGDQTIFFPWERGGGFWRGRGIARARPIIATLLMAGLLWVLGMRERSKTGIRSTQATLGVVAPAIDAYRADHNGDCPASLPLLKEQGYLAADPVDAWGRPLRLYCPSRRDPKSFELLSDGPDGIIEGLERIE